ncbi:MAG: hypothetical protein GX442_14520 [Candidatus Riflebacteria bacterium]|nr:hypothetical protein [Candidatus Riflebacteria bacterium]
MLVLAIGAVMLLLGVTLFQFVGQQNETIHVLAFGEVAHLLAEAGISSSIRAIREALVAAGLGAGEPGPLQKILLQPNPLADTSLMPHLDDSWNRDLKAFAAEVDKSAGIRVEVWLRGFEATETDPARWADPLAKTGWLSIEATGQYKGVSRTLTVRREIRVGSILPPLTPKFTLHLKDANRGQEGRFNVIRNDYQSNITDGPRPIVCLNHATPDSPLEARSVGEVLSGEAAETVWQDRGWIYLGGGKVRLNITSGAGSFGEIFQVYDVSNPNTFQPIRFKSPPSLVPAVFANPVNLHWDRVDLNPVRQVQYSFEHSFVFEGFHDKSSKKDTDAMYEGDILSPADRSTYTSRSNLLHLYGEARKGYQSRTRVLGRVVAAFPRFSLLQVSTAETDVQQMLDTFKPLYPLPSMPERSYDPGREIKDGRGRRVGGPILTAGMLFANGAEYARLMSGIVEVPYVTSYNAMQDVLNKAVVRVFPPEKAILAEDPGTDLEVRRGDFLCYKGPADASRLLEVVQNRVQAESGSIADFWETYFDAKAGGLVLNGVVRIKNPEGLDLFLPPSGKPAPLKVAGGGMIVLEQGNLVLGGVVVTNPAEALSVVLVKGRTVVFASGQPNHLHIFAPGAEVNANAPLQLFGSLAAGDLSPSGCIQGGTIRFREATDPARPSSLAFTKIRVDDQDTMWHE